MQSIYDNKAIEKTLYSFYDEGTFKLPKIYEEKNYAKPFNFLKDWDLVRTFVINNYQLPSNFIPLIERGQFNDN